MYDGTEAILSRNRVPGSRAKGKDIARASKGARWAGRREVNRTESVDNPGEIDNYQDREVFGNEREDDYQDNWG